MPDFDVDFCTERRVETIEYVRRRYHPENVAQIVTFGTLASRAVIKDVGRVMSVPYSDTDRVTKLMDGKSTIRELLGLNIESCRKKVAETENDPDKHDEALKKLADQEGKRNTEFIEIYESDDQLKRVIDMGLKLEGMPRNTSMHAAGVVICRKKIADNVPLSRNGEDITTQFDMKEVESIGMLKMDFLALTTLTDIKKDARLHQGRHGAGDHVRSGVRRSGGLSADRRGGHGRRVPARTRGDEAVHEAASAHLSRRPYRGHFALSSGADGLYPDLSQKTVPSPRRSPISRRSSSPFSKRLTASSSIRSRSCRSSRTWRGTRWGRQTSSAARWRKSTVPS